MRRKYAEFLKKLPNFAALSRARTQDVFRAWQGLGYNRRALFLSRLAKEVTRDFGGHLPRERDALLRLPGVGSSTAGAIAAFAFGKAEPFIETNIRRTYIHFFFPRRRGISDAKLMPLIEATLDCRDPRRWYYALMDYGAMLGVKAKENPNRRSSHYKKQAPFRGSNRELRGKILRLLVSKKAATESQIRKVLGNSSGDVSRALRGLLVEGFIKQKARNYSVVE